MIMQRIQNIQDNMNTIKRKKLKIYSEFNCLPRLEANLPILDDTNFSELRPNLNFTQDIKSAHDENNKNTPSKENDIINIYLRNQKLHSQSSIKNKPISSTPDAENIYFYDTKHKSYCSPLKHSGAENFSYNYSGADISRLLIFMEHTNNTMQRLLKEVKASKTQGTSDFGTTILVIDSEKLQKFFNGECPLKDEKKTPNVCGEDISKEEEEPSVLSNNVTNSSFDITIEQQCIGFKISICKYSLSNLLETLTAVCNMSKYFFPIYEFTKVPSLCVGNWYFRNITQGYLLRILLKNVHVNTLNVMRKLYFVLITDTSPNLNIQINFILKHGIFMVYETELSNTFSPGAVNWNNDHRHILRESTCIDNSYVFNELNDEQETMKLLNAITFAESATSHFQLDKIKKCEDYEESSQTVDKDDASFSYSEMGSMHLIRSDATINFTVHESVGTSFIFSIDELTGQCRELKTKSASTLCNISFESDTDTSLLMLSKLWLSKLFQGSQTISTCLNLHSFDYINETMFDAAPEELGYVKFVNKYWTQFTCQTSYKNFFKCLAQSLVNILFSFRI